MNFIGRTLLNIAFVALFLACFTFCEAFAVQIEKQIIRVGLSSQNFSTFEHTSAKFSSPDELSITDMGSNLQINVEPNKVVKVDIVGFDYTISFNDEILLQNVQGPIVLAPKEKIAIEELNRKGLPAYYGGLIELKTSKEGKFNIVNVLDLQTYLKGVVPNEMPVRFGLEALKAQSVAARNYANRPQNVYKNYDICDSTACQVYYGLNSHNELSDIAVDETKGIFALYENEPILALYHSTAGGITEDWKNVYGNGTLEKPYLRAVADDKKQKFLENEKDVREFYSDKVLSYDIKSPRFRWQVEWTREELEEVLNRTLLEQSKVGLVEPKFEGLYKLEGLKDINILSRGLSGKALEIEIVFDNGTFKVKKELGIRRVLKKDNTILSSANFFVDKKGVSKLQKDEETECEQQENEEASEQNEQEAIFSFEKILSPIKTLKGEYPEKFILTGGGFGHGVGMSQYGAGYMAQNGKTFDEILKHYYTSISLGTMQNEVFYNPYGIEYKTEFYYSKEMFKKCILKLDNGKKISSLNFRINDEIFTPDMSNYRGKMLGMDITKYLKDGVNSIVFAPLEEKDKTKSAVFQIEMSE